MIWESIGHRHHFPAVVPLIADTGVHGDLVVGGGVQAGGVIFTDFFHGGHLIGFGPQLGGQGDLVPGLQRVELPKMVVDAPVVCCQRDISTPNGGVLGNDRPLLANVLLSVPS